MAKHTRDSWGSLQYDAKRRTARIRYWAEGSDGYRRRSKTIRNVTRKEAEAARAALMLEHGEDAPCPTVRQVWERWVIPEMDERIKRREAESMQDKRSSRGMSMHTKQMYESSWRVHVNPRWGDVPCDQVRPLDVQQWISTKTRGVAEVAIIVLRLVMEKASMYEVITSNPMRNKYLMPSQGRKSDDGIWSAQELGDVMHAVRGSWCEPAIMLMGLGSCRVGEALGPYAGEVELRDVDGVHLAVVPIVRQITNAKRVSGSLKNKWSYRSVVIPGPCGERLHSIAQAKNSNMWLTDNGVGHFVYHKNIREEFTRLLKENGLAVHPMRNLRPSWQTMMRWDMGLPPWIIERLMGHVGEGVTGRHYDRPEVDEFCEVIAREYRNRPFDRNWTYRA